MDQVTKKRSRMQLFAIMGIVFVSIIIVVVVVALGGGGLSGRYELVTDSNVGFDFKSENKVVIYTGDSDKTMDGTYTLTDSRLEIRVKSSAGLDILFAKGTVSDNNREIMLNISDNQVTFVKK
ncbi:MAG: hypothetical protein LBH79_06955 [Nitrososphaerota archaeon]|nr:hypothetical protein [Nitrososphaerota archaeon]